MTLIIFGSLSRSRSLTFSPNEFVDPFLMILTPKKSRAPLFQLSSFSSFRPLVWVWGHAPKIGPFPLRGDPRREGAGRRPIQGYVFVTYVKVLTYLQTACTRLNISDHSNSIFKILETYKRSNGRNLLTRKAYSSTTNCIIVACSLGGLRIW